MLLFNELKKNSVFIYLDDGVALMMLFLSNSRLMNEDDILYTILILLGIGNEMLFKCRKSCSCGEIKRKWARTNLKNGIKISKFDAGVNVIFVIRIYWQ